MGQVRHGSATTMHAVRAAIQRSQASLATLDAAIWGAELAEGNARERLYVVEPTGAFVDDPNVTDAKFPGNPTRSYRSRDPLRVIGEVPEWQGYAPEQLQAMKAFVARMRAEGVEAID